MVEEIEAAGGAAVGSHDSVASPQGGEAIVRAAVERFGRLDTVVSNAGIFNSVPLDLEETGLARRACEFTHRNYSACAGRFARVFVGLGEGWLAEPGSNPTADDIAAQLAEVSATEPFTVPGSIFEEVFAVCDRLGVNV